MVARLILSVCIGLFLTAVSGCGNSPKKGAEKDRDMPKSAEKEG